MKELSLAFEHFTAPDGSNNCETAVNFLETQRSTLKSLRLEGCYVSQLYSLRLLSFNFVRLEIHFSFLEMSRYAPIENLTIESLAFIGILCHGNSNHQEFEAGIDRQ